MQKTGLYDKKFPQKILNIGNSCSYTMGRRVMERNRPVLLYLLFDLNFECLIWTDLHLQWWALFYKSSQ